MVVMTVALMTMLTLFLSPSPTRSGQLSLTWIFSVRPPLLVSIFFSAVSFFYSLCSFCVARGPTDSATQTVGARRTAACFGGCGLSGMLRHAQPLPQLQPLPARLPLPELLNARRQRS